MPSTSHRRAHSRTLRNRGRVARGKKKAVTPSLTEVKATKSEVPVDVAPVEKAIPEPVVEAPQVESERAKDSNEELVVEEPAPSAEEMAAYLGAAGSLDDTGSKADTGDKSLPTLEEAESLVPAKAKALMDELFRARLEKVKRIDPKEIR